MAKYTRKSDTYEWQLALAPEAAIALLRAVCVDSDTDANGRQYLRNLLWGPKGWGVSFKHRQFRLLPLERTTLHRIVCPSLGTVVDAQGGSLVLLTFQSSTAERRMVKALAALAACFAACVGTIVVSNVLPFESLWLGLLAIVGICGWFLFGFGWLGPAVMRSEPIRFLDQVFEGHCVPIKVSSTRKLRTTVQETP